MTRSASIYMSKSWRDFTGSTAAPSIESGGGRKLVPANEQALSKRALWAGAS